MQSLETGLLRANQENDKNVALLESHKENLVKLLLRDYEACDDLFPTYHLPKLIEKSQDKFEKVIEKYLAA